MPKVKRKARGFSLIELLIVVSLMVILAGGIVLSMRGGLDKAKMARTLSDLSGLRSAVALYQASTLGTAQAETAPTVEQLKEYVDGLKGDGEVKVWPAGGAQGPKWYVGIGGITPGSELANKLAEQAASQGLLAGSGGEPSGAYQGGDTVWVRVR